MENCISIELHIEVTNAWCLPQVMKMDDRDALREMQAELQQQLNSNEALTEEEKQALRHRLEHVQASLDAAQASAPAI